MIIYVYRSRCEVPLIFNFKGNLIFSTDLRKNTQISDFLKIRSVGTELFHVDGRARHDEANSRFSQFCEEA